MALHLAAAGCPGVNIGRRQNSHWAANQGSSTVHSTGSIVMTGDQIWLGSRQAGGCKMGATQQAAYVQQQQSTAGCGLPSTDASASHSLSDLDSHSSTAQRLVTRCSAAVAYRAAAVRWARRSRRRRCRSSNRRAAAGRPARLRWRRGRRAAGCSSSAGARPAGRPPARRDCPQRCSARRQRWTCFRASATPAAAPAPRWFPAGMFSQAHRWQLHPRPLWCSQVWHVSPAPRFCV